jgi:hypothetical protein
MDIGTFGAPTDVASIGQVDAEGDLYVHTDRLITNGAAVGAYLLSHMLAALQGGALDLDDFSLELLLTANEASVPYVIFVNRGRDGEALEESAQVERFRRLSGVPGVRDAAPTAPAAASLPGMRAANGTAPRNPPLDLGLNTAQPGGPGGLRHPRTSTGARAG